MTHEHIKISRDGPSLLKPVFIDPDAHSSLATALALAGNPVVSGSPDEVIQMFYVSRRCGLGCLELHAGCVHCLQLARDLDLTPIRTPAAPFSRIAEEPKLGAVGDEEIHASLRVCFCCGIERAIIREEQIVDRSREETHQSVHAPAIPITVDPVDDAAL
ncbi:p21-activated protein kinase-interacting protein 1-like protein [Sparganum proliferum]